MKSAKRTKATKTNSTEPQEMHLVIRMNGFTGNYVVSKQEFDTLMIDESNRLYLCDQSESDFEKGDIQFSPKIFHRVDLVTALRWYVSIARGEYDGSGDPCELCELALEALGSPFPRTIKQELLSRA